MSGLPKTADAARAVDLKNDGNRHFNAGDFTRAEALYSKALIADPTNPSLYTNRAMARLRMSLWQGAIEDCTTCLKLTGDNNMKANYYLSQAHLPLKNHDDALQHALKAHEICVKTGDKSLSAVTAQVLRCKKDRWEDLERKRRRETSSLESEVLSLLSRERDDLLSDPTNPSDESSRTEIRQEWDAKMELLARIFDKAREADEKRRKVPDWAIDDISFNIMVDPVITKSGKSYERASILEHIRRDPAHAMDPVTRQPLLVSDLRPNIDLKRACDEFLEENGWAADW
ncbi:hypothetical protein V8F06_013216 [Rhypophila decipiens]